MLVLSRRANEQIVFPTLDIVVNVNCCTNKYVRLGIEAPRHIRIARSELESSDPTMIEALSAESQPLDSGFLPGEVLSEKTQPEDIQSQIDTIKLAVQLAQTQLNHRRDERCQDALAYALQAVNRLESSVANSPDENEWAQAEPTVEAVREIRCGYHVGT